MKHTYSINQHHTALSSLLADIIEENYDVLSAPMEFDPRTTLGAYDEAQGTAKADERKLTGCLMLFKRALFGERM